MLVPEISAVFVHIEKTGGSSARRVLVNSYEAKTEDRLPEDPAVKHATAQDWLDIADGLKIPLKFFVTIYRHPHERLVSHALWRLQHSASYRRYQKRLSITVLWKSIRSSKSMTDYLTVPAAKNFSLVILDFSELDTHLEELVKVTGGAARQAEALIHVNQNPLRKTSPQFLPAWTAVARIMVFFTRHRHDCAFNPRGQIIITSLPQPRHARLPTPVSH